MRKLLPILFALSLWPALASAQKDPASRASTPNPFIDPQRYREHVKAVEERYREQLAREAKAGGA